MVNFIVAGESESIRGVGASGEILGSAGARLSLIAPRARDKSIPRTAFSQGERQAASVAEIAISADNGSGIGSCAPPEF